MTVPPARRVKSYVYARTTSSTVLAGNELNGGNDGMFYFRIVVPVSPNTSFTPGCVTRLPDAMKLIIYNDISDQ